MTQSTNRFSLFDLLALVTAFSIAFAMLVFHQRQWAAYGAKSSAINTLTMTWYGVGTTLSVCTYYLGATVLRRRPSLKSLVRSSGRTAILAMCFVSLLAVLAAWDSFFASVFSLPATLLHLPFTIHGSPLVAASAGLTGWFTVSVAAHNKYPPDWLDRAGKICSLVWLLLAFVQPVLNFKVLKAIGFPLD